MSSSLSFTLAYQHVRAGLGRVALSVLAIALGVALVVAVRLMNVSVLASFLDSVDGIAGRAALTVTAGQGATFSEDIVQSIGAVPGVKLAVPLVRSVAFPDDGSGELLTVFGVDLTHEAAVRVYHAAERSTEVIDDLLVFLNQSDSIVLGREFAVARGLDIGSPIPLVTPTGVKTFTVRGLLDPQGLVRTLGGRLVVMDLHAAELTFTAEGQVSQIDLLLAEGATVETVKAAVAATLPTGLTVEEPQLRKDAIRKTIGGFQAMMTAFSILAVLAGFVICYSRLGAIFEARTWEVGLLRAVGLRQTVVFAELLKESLLVGATGTVLGVLLGFVIAHYGLPIAARTSAIASRLPVTAAEHAARVDAVALGAVVGLLAAIVSALVPALRLARKQPVAALTMRGRDIPLAPRGRSGVVGVGLVLLSLGLIAWQQVSHVMEIGLVTTAVLALAAGAAAGPIVRHGAHWLRALWEAVFGVTGEFASGNLSRQPRRAALTVATLGLGLGAVLMFGFLESSFEHTLIAKLTASLRADLIISSPFASGGYREAPFSEQVIHELEGIPGVAFAVGEQNIDLNYGTEQPPVLKSYDPVGLRDPRALRWPLDTGALPDALALVERGDAVLVTTAFAYQHGTRAGETLDLITPNGPATVRVAGVTSGQPENAIVMSRNQYRAAWNDPFVNLVHVVLDQGADREAVRETIMRSVGAKYRLQVRSSGGLVDYLAGQVRQAFSVLYLLEAITFLLVLLGIGDTLATGVIERGREFAMMRAVGLHRARLFEIVMLEGVGIGLFGLVLAIVTGFGLGFFWLEVQFPALVGWRLEAHFPGSFAVIAAALTMLICVVGSLLPSLRASRLSVAQTLRNE